MTKQCIDLRVSAFPLPCLTVVERDGSQFHHRIHMQLKTITITTTTTVRNAARLVFYLLLFHRIISVPPVFTSASQERPAKLLGLSRDDLGVQHPLPVAVLFLLREAR